MAWGVIITFFAAATNSAGAVAVRFFLGALEASVSPGFLLRTSQVSSISLAHAFTPASLANLNAYVAVHEARTRHAHCNMGLLQRLCSNLT